jgi:2-oxoacid:acceptor oxidoreductase delta subunit (pyruvate/2-ketoisovalerate family)
MAKEKGSKQLPIGGLILDAGNAIEYKTGGWRTYRPVVDRDVCTNCLQCWLFCPDMCINVEEGKMVGYDYEHCKGCGICAAVCPVKAIKMVLETESGGQADEKGCIKKSQIPNPKSQTSRENPKSK